MLREGPLCSQDSMQNSIVRLYSHIYFLLPAPTSPCQMLLKFHSFGLAFAGLVLGTFICAELGVLEPFCALLDF